MVSRTENLQQILFIGGLFDDQARHENDVFSIGASQAAADVLQWGYVTGLESLPEVSLTILSSPFIGSYPKRYRKIYVPNRSFIHGSAEQHKLVGFLNLPLIKHVWRSAALARNAKQWMETAGPGALVLGYSLSLDVMWALRSAGRHSIGASTAVVIPDLPEYMNTSDKPRLAYIMLKRAESYIVRHLLSKTSFMILLTAHMRGRLPDLPSLIVEGVTPQDVQVADPVPSAQGCAERCSTIMYAGTMNARYGVLDLCHAFMGISDTNLRLVLCGAGDAEDRIRQLALVDQRIEYRGLMPRAEVIKMEARATLLVNPRTNAQEFAAFSFPSKTLEYLASGRPVLCHKLDGIPDEYDQFLHYVTDDTIEGLRSAIIEILTISDAQLSEFGSAGREFVQTYKNPAKQMRLLINFFRTQTSTVTASPFSNQNDGHEGGC